MYFMYAVVTDLFSYLSLVNTIIPWQGKQLAIRSCICPIHMVWQKIIIYLFIYLFIVALFGLNFVNCNISVHELDINNYNLLDIVLYKSIIHSTTNATY